MQLIVLLILLPFSLALYTSISVGQLFVLTVPDGVEICFPRWFNSFKYGIWGIPGIEDIGLNIIAEKREGKPLRNVELLFVHPEKYSPCFPDETSWLEIHFNKTPSLENKINSLNYTSHSLKVDVDTLRVYDYEYSRTNRRLEPIGHQDQTPGQYLITWPIGCTTFNNATDIMADFLDRNLTYHSVYLAQGFFKLRESYPVSNGKNVKYRSATKNVWRRCFFGICF